MFKRKRGKWWEVVIGDVEQAVSYHVVSSSFKLVKRPTQTFRFPIQSSTNLRTSVLPWLSSTIPTWEFWYSALLWCVNAGCGSCDSKRKTSPLGGSLLLQTQVFTGMSSPKASQLSTKCPRTSDNGMFGKSSWLIFQETEIILILCPSASYKRRPLDYIFSYSFTIKIHFSILPYNKSTLWINQINLQGNNTIKAFDGFLWRYIQSGTKSFHCNKMYAISYLILLGRQIWIQI